MILTLCTLGHELINHPSYVCRIVLSALRALTKQIRDAENFANFLAVYQIIR
jgi:hypothetical protein